VSVGSSFHTQTRPPLQTKKEKRKRKKEKKEKNTLLTQVDSFFFASKSDKISCHTIELIYVLNNLFEQVVARHSVGFTCE